ncbi:MAG: PHP domain-containing protein, partial [Pseudomonadota bacterium]
SMLVDLHCHSKFSHDNYLEPEALIREAIEAGLDGVCFTEHHSLLASLPVEKIEVPDGFYVFRGLEISTNQGHILVYGLRDDSWNIWGRNNYLDCRRVMERVYSLGGICVAAHPYRPHDSLGEDLSLMNGLDAIETHNGLNSREENDRAMRAASLNGLPSVGGSDCHSERQVGAAYTIFKNPISTIEDLVTEVRSGNCRGMARGYDHITL